MGELETAIKQYFALTNQSKPFVWTKTADENCNSPVAAEISHNRLIGNGLPGLLLEVGHASINFFDRRDHTQRNINGWIRRHPGAIVHGKSGLPGQRQQNSQNPITVVLKWWADIKRSNGA